MKKIVTLLLSLILVGMLGVAMAESADVVEVAPGETLELDVVLTAGGGEAAKIGIQTNEAPVSFVSAVGGSVNDTVPPKALEGYFVVINADGLSIAADGTSMTGSSYTVKELEAGLIGKLSFKVDETAGEGTYTVSVLVASGKCTSDSSITFNVSGSARIAGDANCDGVVDVFDALAIMQFKSGFEVTISEINANCDGNETVDVFDALRIMQFKSGFDVVLQ